MVLFNSYKARLVAKGFTHKQNMDYFTDFLNGDLEQKIYMTQLERSVVPNQEDKMC